MRQRVGQLLHAAQMRAAPLREIVLARLDMIEAPFRAAAEQIAAANISSRRALTVSIVAGAHVVFLFALLRGLAPAMPSVPNEIPLTLSGIFAPKADPPRPIPVRDISKDVVTVPPALIENDAPAIDVRAAVVPASTPDVSMPSQALADAHAFPVLPPSVHVQAQMSVRLVLSIAEDGAVSAAQVVSSCGLKTLDDLAVQWVRDHWRYKPAMRQGQAIADTTTAIVVFLQGAN